MRRQALIVSILLAGMLLAGCVERRVTIKSDPPGAFVYVDGQEVGETPCAFAFTFYGTREFVLDKPGYQRAVWREKIRAPWYEVFPIDFFAENLWPAKIVDERVVERKLEPVKPVDRAKLMERANELRARGMEMPMGPSEEKTKPEDKTKKDKKP